jgi:divalent metal cation (Fe/Co/Zn/Cd) transporter
MMHSYLREPTILAGAVLLVLLFNALFGWWWADPLAALVIVY